MSQAREILIARLVADARPVWRVQPMRVAWLWLALSAVLCSLVFAVSGSFRTDALSGLLHSPRSVLQLALGLCAIVVLARAAFASGVPTASRHEWRDAAPIALCAAWIALHLYGLVDPAEPLFMLGERHHCWLEVVACGIVGYAVATLSLRRWWPLDGLRTGALLGLAAGATPALIMHYACMQAPGHALLFHLMPAFALALVGAVAGRYYLQRA